MKTYPKNSELYFISFWWSRRNPLKGPELSLQTLVGIFHAKGEKKQKLIKWHNIEDMGDWGGRRWPGQVLGSISRSAGVGRCVVCTYTGSTERKWINELILMCLSGNTSICRLYEYSVCWCVLCLDTTSAPPKHTSAPNPGACLLWNLVTNMESLRGMIKTQNIGLYTKCLNNIDVGVLNLIIQLSVDGFLYQMWNFQRIDWDSLLKVILGFGSCGRVILKLC